MTLRFGIAACLLGLVFVSGCNQWRNRMRSITAGETGCTENEVELLEVQRRNGSASWVAKCRGQQHVCSVTGCSIRQQSTETEPQIQDVVRTRRASSRQTLTFATSDGNIRAVRATFVTVDSEVSLTVGPERTDEVIVEVRSTTRVPLSACENISFHRGDAVASAHLEDGRARLPLATLSRLFSAGPERKTARFCGRVLLIGSPEQALFTRLEQNIPRIGSTDTSGGEDATHEEQASEPAVQASAIRARLDAESPTLHACAGAAGPLRVLAAWDESGVVTITLDSADNAINECIQAGIQWPALEVQAAGSLIHVVHEATPDEI